jgi:hypothetical protein
VGLIGSVFCMAMSSGIANGVLPGSLLPSWLNLFWKQRGDCSSCQRVRVPPARDGKTCRGS